MFAAVGARAAGRESFRGCHQSERTEDVRVHCDYAIVPVALKEALKPNDCDCEGWLSRPCAPARHSPPTTRFDVRHPTKRPPLGLFAFVCLPR